VTYTVRRRRFPLFFLLPLHQVAVHKESTVAEAKRGTQCRKEVRARPSDLLFSFPPLSPIVPFGRAKQQGNREFQGHFALLVSRALNHLALSESYHPLWAAIQSSLTLRWCPVMGRLSGSRTGFSPSLMPHSEANSYPVHPRDTSAKYNPERGCRVGVGGKGGLPTLPPPYPLLIDLYPGNHSTESAPSLFLSRHAHVYLSLAPCREGMFNSLFWCSGDVGDGARHISRDVTITMHTLQHHFAPFARSLFHFSVV